jgi:hypothetical protein
VEEVELDHDLDDDPEAEEDDVVDAEEREPDQPEITTTVPFIHEW